MKVSLSLEVSESQRNALAQLIDGKSIKRLATRDEVRAFVEQLIESLATDSAPLAVQTQVDIRPSPDLGGLAAVANARVAEMREEGKTEEYIQSWLKGFRGKPKKERD